MGTTSFWNNHQSKKIGKPNNLPEISEIENFQRKYEYMCALRLQ
jgi:hypothetical protein